MENFRESFEEYLNRKDKEPIIKYSNKTYFDFLAKDLIIIILKFIDIYDILQYADFLENINPINYDIIFETAFLYNYPLIYEDIKKVINDDIYLNNNLEKLPNWVLLYGTFKNFNIDNILISFSIKDYKDLDKTLEIPDIIYRAAFNKFYPEIYNNIKEYESFNFDAFYGLEESLRYNPDKKDKKNAIFIISKDCNFILKWNNLYKIFSYDWNNPKYDIENIINNFLVNLLEQTNMLKILKILLNNEFSKHYLDANIYSVTINNIELYNPLPYYIYRYSTLNSVKDLYTKFDYKVYKKNILYLKKQQLYEFLFKNNLIASTDMYGHDLLEFIKYDYYKIVKLIIESIVMYYNEHNIDKSEYAWLDLDFKIDYNRFDIDFRKYNKLLKFYS